MNRLADIHTHITPNVDDGSTSMESIRQAAAETDIPVQICKGCEIYTYGRNIEWNLQALEK